MGDADPARTIPIGPRTVEKSESWHPTPRGATLRHPTPSAPNAQKPAARYRPALFGVPNVGLGDARSGLGIGIGRPVVGIFTFKHPTPNTQRPTPNAQHPTPKNQPFPILKPTLGKVIRTPGVPHLVSGARSGAWSWRYSRSNTQRPGTQRLGGDPAPPNAQEPTARCRQALLGKDIMAPGDARAGLGIEIGRPVVEISAFEHPTPSRPNAHRAPNAQKPTDPDRRALFRQSSMGLGNATPVLGDQIRRLAAEIFASQHPTPWGQIRG